MISLINLIKNFEIKLEGVLVKEITGLIGIPALSIFGKPYNLSVVRLVETQEFEEDFFNVGFWVSCYFVSKGGSWIAIMFCKVIKCDKCNTLRLKNWVK